MRALRTEGDSRLLSAAILSLLDPTLAVSWMSREQISDAPVGSKHNRLGQQLRPAGRSIRSLHDSASDELLDVADIAPAGSLLDIDLCPAKRRKRA